MHQATTAHSGFQSKQLVCCSQQAGDTVPCSASNVSNSSPPSGLGRFPNPAQDLEWQRKDTYFSREVQFKRISLCCSGQSHANTVFPRTLGQRNKPTGPTLVTGCPPFDLGSESLPPLNMFMVNT